MLHPDFKRIHLKIPRQKIQKTITEQLSFEVPIAKDFAQPLFDLGVRSIALAKKEKYQFIGPPRKFHYHIMTLLLQGKMRITLGDNHYKMKPGMLAFCPDEEKFYRYSEGPVMFIYINLFDRPIWEPLKQHGSYIREYESTDLFFILLSRIFEDLKRQTVQSRINALEDAAMLGSLIKRENNQVMNRHLQPYHRQLNSLVAEIMIKPENDWTVQTMADYINVSPRTLNRIFHREYAMGPMDMVIKKRLDKAMHALVNTNKKIEVIASQLNYKSPYSFSNLFLRHLGMRPGEFRAKFHSAKDEL